jgi:hypothetical protein
MKLQQYLINNYLHIPYEDFSHRATAARGILLTLKGNPISQLTPQQKNEIEAAIMKITEIIDTTEKKLQVSLFVLDRNITPQDFSKTPVTYNTTFKRVRAVGDSRFVKLTADEIQNYLCYALLRIEEILMNEIAKLSDQFIFDG